MHSSFVAAAAMLVLLLSPKAALAHGNLKSSQPSAGAHLAAAPRELRLDFTEAPELAFTRIELLGPDGEMIPLSTLSFASDSRRSVITAVRGALAAGTYTVAWQMAGTDGHPVRGRFTFTIAPGAEGLGVPHGEASGSVTAPGQTSPSASHHNAASMPGGDDFGAESTLYVVIRWLQFIGLVVAIGAVVFNAFVLGFLRRRKDPRFASMVTVSRDRTAQLGLIATGIVGVVSLLRLFAQSYAMHGATNAYDGSLVATMLAHTVWGWGWIAQDIGVFVAAAGFLLARRGRSAAWGIATLGIVLLAFTPGLSGHAASAPRLTILAILADGVHIMGASGWLGSLFFVVAIGIPAALQLAESDRGGAVAELVNAFSPTALVFAGVTAATGVFAAWLHLGTIPALWQSSYGRMLLLKLGVLSVVAATGAYNWLRVKPALGDALGATRVRRSASIELTVGVLVLFVTAILVATPTAMDAAAMQP